MKPIVIYLNKSNDKIQLTQKEFEDYITQAYNQGYSCGYAEGRKNHYWYNYPIAYPNGNINTISSADPNSPPWTITCDADSNSTLTINKIGSNLNEKT